MNEEPTTLLRATSRHCAAFFYAWSFGEIAFRNAEEEYIQEQGTVTFVKNGNEFYAITNEHVLGEDWSQRLRKETLMVALERHSFWGIRPIFTSPPSKARDVFYPANFPRDIAIFPFSNNCERLRNADKEAIQLPNVMPDLEVGEIVLAVGFPGEKRRAISKNVAGHKLAHVFGTVRAVTENNIVIQDTNPAKDKDISFGGMSGGPIFKIIDEKNLSYTLVGIVYEGRGLMNTDEHGQTQFSDDIWIFWFPLDGERMDAMLEYKSP